jgi:[acyl-carrier-protein] S-malonyltransferase
MARAFVFPGQGSQTVGMGKAVADAFPVAREVFQEVDDALGRRLSRLMWEGPMDELTLTANTQPALMAHSIATLRVMEKEAGVRMPDVKFVAGHSLGEYSALCAARALSVAAAARLLRIRGEAMQEAAPPGTGAMAALLGADLEAAQKAIDASPGKGVCEIANDNAPGQIVISGEQARVEAACASARRFGFKMAKLLPVSAPFHSSLMAPAAARMREALEEAELKAPAPALIANVTAREASSPDDIRDFLVQQVTGRVRWTESVSYMAEQGCDAFIEIGAGRVLAGLVKRTAKDAKTISVGEPADVEAFLRL